MICDSIKKHTNMLLSRKLTLHQRVTYANACLLSKLWYVAHIYPLPDNHAKNLNKVIFQYIWGGRYEPIKRTTVCKPKDEGGLAIVNCLMKAKTLMVKTFIKTYIHDSYRNSLLFYYCYLRLNNVLPSDYSTNNSSPVATPYYSAAITLTMSLLHLPGFPFIPKDKIYQHMIPKDKSLSELQYPTLNWQKVWDNYLSLFIYSFDKDIIYKHLHMCLTTNKRLHSMNLIESSKCDKCISDREETPIHMFYECDYVKPVFLWVLRCLSHLCNFKPSSNIRFLYFDNTFNNSTQKNVCNIFIYIYVITLWRTRKENLRIGDLQNLIIRKFIDYRKFIKLVSSHRFKKNYLKNLHL